MTNPQLLVCVLLVASIALDLSSGQTFQYSRGWINGKRTDPMIEQIFGGGGHGAHATESADEGTLLGDGTSGQNTPSAVTSGANAPTDISPGIDSESCTLDQRDVIVLTRDRMLQLLIHAMHSLRSVKVVVCVNPELKSTYLQATF